MQNFLSEVSKLIRVSMIEAHYEKSFRLLSLISLIRISYQTFLTSKLSKI